MESTTKYKSTHELFESLIEECEKQVNFFSRKRNKAKASYQNTLAILFTSSLCASSTQLAAIVISAQQDCGGNGLEIKESGILVSCLCAATTLIVAIVAATWWVNRGSSSKRMVYNDAANAFKDLLSQVQNFSQSNLLAGRDEVPNAVDAKSRRQHDQFRLEMRKIFYQVNKRWNEEYYESHVNVPPLAVSSTSVVASSGT